ncbi:AAA family ATPase [Burkholderia orbicola]|uniref:AAA family ATPase n=1 Tax=Burkholderia orbicola TaxID=2978683 RepID=UPI00264FF8A6|nr:AAA family ATPase [Burkholderia orbicola]MDN7560322.1 AAA family ATPase [Burkholderia orbicola]
MTELPVLELLQIRQYGLYPGPARDGTFDIPLAPGLTVVLGANGLGKSTLVNILFRMLSGPWDLKLPDGNVGTTELTAQALSAKRRSTFSARVNDNARDAQSTLTYFIGAKKFEVTRSLMKLGLISFKVDDGPESSDEEELKRAILSASNVGTFGEWIFLLRTMVFFFEDRRMLVWDPSAQRQLLRCLFLEPAQAHDWITAEREIVELDTRMRNLKAALDREEREEKAQEHLSKAAPEVRATLKSKETLYEAALKQQEEISQGIEELDSARRRHRLDSLRANEALHAVMHELERARLSAIETRFPTADESMRYIFSRLMSDDVCIVCQTPGRTEKRVQMLHAIDNKHCILCDADMEPSTGNAVDINEERVIALREKVKQATITADAAHAALDDSSQAFDTANLELAERNVEVATLKADIDALVRQLPADEQAARRQNDGFADLKKRTDQLRADLQVKREAFARQMNQYRKQIQGFAERIKAEFDAIAGGFLLETASLSWAPTRVLLGQAGTGGLDLTTEYPSFSVEMTGANFSDVVRRDSPEQVSESQREFIDLAFRMALVKVGSRSQASTIIIDAPESSLDAVFVNRAAAVLAAFANDNQSNRLIVTSNLAAGKLIPAVLKAAEANPQARLDRIVDLFNAGVSTRAMVELRAEYEALRSDLFTEILETPHHDGRG